MRGVWAAAGIVGGLLAGACVDLLPYQCSEDDDCRSGAVQGWCESVQYCSYPDDECESGRRFGDLAGSFADTCTGVFGGSSTSPVVTGSSSEVGDTGSSTSTGTSSGTGSESSGPGDPLCGNGMLDVDEECDDGNPIDGDGCNTDCVAGGSIRWSATLDGSVGGNDRYFAVTRVGEAMMGGGEGLIAVGYTHDNPKETGDQAMLLSRWSLDGVEDARRAHDISPTAGDFDEALALTRDGLGRVLVCGRSDSDPWLSLWTIDLVGDPVFDGRIPMLNGQCHDIVQISTSDNIAIGGNSSGLWTYRFSLTSITDGVATEVAETTVMDTDTHLLAGFKAPSEELFLAGQLNDEAVVYASEEDTILDSALYTSAVEMQPQGLAVTDTDFILGGLRRVGARDGDDFWVASFDIESTAENWVWWPQRLNINEIEDIALDAAGNVYAIGHTAENANPDLWVGKIDVGGTLIWERDTFEFSALGNDRGRAVEVLPDGDIVVVGEVTNDAGNLDAWIARLAP